MLKCMEGKMDNGVNEDTLRMSASKREMEMTKCLVTASTFMGSFCWFYISFEMQTMYIQNDISERVPFKMQLEQNE